jgi:hypothetical protein
MDHKQAIRPYASAKAFTLDSGQRPSGSNARLGLTYQSLAGVVDHLMD